MISETGRNGKQTPWNTLLEKRIVAKHEPLESNLYPYKGALQLKYLKVAISWPTAWVQIELKFSTWKHLTLAHYSVTQIHSNI